MLTRHTISSCAELITYIDLIGFLPLLHNGIYSWSAEDALIPNCGYTTLPDGGWEWPLWEWKADIIKESGCAYGKFILGKACFISRHWWPDFCNYRRSIAPSITEGSIEEMILLTLQENRSMTTRELRAACGFTQPNMRGKFDTYIRRLEQSCRIVTEDFVYPTDKRGNRYGWGWSLLTTPERLLGKQACFAERTPEESLQRMVQHFKTFMPDAYEMGIMKLLS